jgi:hypothetical protein
VSPEQEEGCGDGSSVAARRRPSRRVAFVAAVLVAAAGAGGGVQLARGGTAAHGAPAIAIGEGDVVKVAGAPIGCIVRRENGLPTLDCRRIGPLAGTYGTMLTARGVTVVRFLSGMSARVVFTARHRSLRARTCG